MGLDVTAVLLHGIKVWGKDYNPLKLDHSYEIDDLFFGDNWKNLNFEILGSCEEEEVFIADFCVSNHWLATEIALDSLPRAINIDSMNELSEFCKKYQILLEPKWYLGTYTSH